MDIFVLLIISGFAYLLPTSFRRNLFRVVYDSWASNTVFWKIVSFIKSK